MFGGNLFVIVNDGVTFIPITDLAGKSEEDIEALIDSGASEADSMPS